MTKRNSFVFYDSWWEAIKYLPRDVQGDVLTAIVEYGLTGETTGQLKPIANAMLAMAKAQIDVNNEKFINGCKGGEYGSKGGAPKGNQNARKTTPKQPQNNPKTTPNVNDNVNVNVNDNVNDKERVKEKVPDGTPFTPNEGKQKKTSQVDLFVEQFNAIRGTKFKPTDKVCRQFNARIKEGFTTEQMLDALKNAMQDDFHKGNGFKYLTPEFFTRSDKIDMFANRTIASETLSKNSLLDSLKQFKKERGMD